MAAYRMQLSSRCKKTKMCKFFLANKCERGDLCSYAHAQKELRIPPDLAGTQLCPAVMEGLACKNNFCRFAHSAAEVKTFPGGSSQHVTLHDGGNKTSEEEMSSYESFGVCLRNTFLTIDENRNGDAFRRTCSAPGRLISPQEYITYIVVDKDEDSRLPAEQQANKKRQAKKKRTNVAAPNQGDRMLRPLPAGPVGAISK